VEDFEKALAFAENLQTKFDTLDLLRQSTIAAVTISVIFAVIMGIGVLASDAKHTFYFEGLAVAICCAAIFGVWEARIEQKCKRERLSLSQVTRMLHEIKDIYTFSPIEQVLYRSRLARLEFGPDEDEKKTRAENPS
jgi:hypothetical protein